MSIRFRRTRRLVVSIAACFLVPRVLRVLCAHGVLRGKVMLVNDLLHLRCRNEALEVRAGPSGTIRAKLAAGHDTSGFEETTCVRQDAALFREHRDVHLGY